MNIWLAEIWRAWRAPGFLLLAIAGLQAGLLPALRTARVHPVHALRGNE